MKDQKEKIQQFFWKDIDLTEGESTTPLSDDNFEEKKKNSLAVPKILKRGVQGIALILIIILWFIFIKNSDSIYFSMQIKSKMDTISSQVEILKHIEAELENNYLLVKCYKAQWERAMNNLDVKKWYCEEMYPEVF